MKKFRSKFESNFNRLTEGKLSYETTKLKYTVPTSIHTYTPDFHIPGTNIYLETKGRFTSQDRKKMLLVKAQHPDKRVIMVFMNAKTPITKGSKTTYADWCLKNGVEFMSTHEAAEFIKCQQKR